MKKSYRQQVSKQIFDSTKSIGKVRPKNAKFFDNGDININADENVEDQVTKWRKRWFILEKPTQYYTPKETDFISYVLDGNTFSTTYLSGTNGGFADKQIPQYSVVVYDLEVYRNSQATLRFSLNTNKSVAIQVNNTVIYDSGDSSPNSRQSIDINLPTRAWTRIEIYFYTSSERTDENKISFKPTIFDTRAFDKTRIPVPEPPNSISAETASSTSINVSWSVLDQSKYEYFQIYYGTTSDASDVLEPGINSSKVPLLYTHVGLTPGTTYYYKVRGLTEEGEVTDFTSVASATTDNIIENFNQLELTFLPNSTTELSGYYSDSDITVTGLVIATNGPVADSSDILVIASGYDNVMATGTLLLTEVNKYYFGFNLSPFQDGLINVVASYTDSGYTIPWASGSIILDNVSPVYQFVLDGDTYYSDSNEDTWTRSSSVYLYTTSGFDSSAAATTGLNGLRSVSNIYQIRAGETPATMSGASWIEYSNTTALPFTLSAVTGLKTVYAQSRDRSGNLSTYFADSIYYATGTIEAVQNDYIATSYSFLDVKWIRPARGDIQGYDLWYTVDGMDPDHVALPINVKYLTRIYDPAVTSFRHYWDGQINGVKVFPFTLGDAVQDIEYYYWVKAFTADGQISENYSASGFSGLLDSREPYDDEALTTGVVDGSIRIRFRAEETNPNTTFEEGRAYEHLIYRLDISENPGSINVLDTNALLIQTINATQEDAQERFYIYDIPPEASHFYQYFSVARNFWGYIQTGETPNPVSTGIRLNDGPPSKPGWHEAQFVNKWWGIRLAIDNPTETDIVSYTIYTASGDETAETDPTDLTDFHQYTFPYDSLNDPNQPLFIMLRENLLNPNGMNTFWAKATDSANLSSVYSDPIMTGVGNSIPPAPIWVSGECFNWFGYNHLVASGNIYSDGLLQGYHIYRSEDTTFGNASIIGSILNNNSDGQKVAYDDHDANPFTPYYYWCTAYNVFDTESSPSAMLTLSGTVQPNYGELFNNTLDNSSFERPLDSDRNWAVTTPTQLVSSESKFGASSILVHDSSNAKLVYSGYIFCQPDEQYLFSMYVKTNSVSAARNIRVTGIWYSIDRETEAGRFGTTWLNDTLTLNDWERVTGSIFTAPTNATNAYLEIYGNNTLTNWYVDACQWETYSGGVSPRPYVNSQTFGVDKFQAHFIKGDMLEFESIKGNKIVAETISGREILGGSITAEKLAIQPGLAVPYFGMDLITSGIHTIYVSGGILHNYGRDYNITSVAAIDGGNDSAVGRLFSTTDDNTDPYYAYYDNVLSSGVLNFTRDLGTALGGDFIVWKFTNTLEVIDSTDSRQNAGFFVFNGAYGGPGIQMEGSQITAGSINGRIIEAGTLSADRIVAGGLTNLIKNGSFEFSEVNSFVGLTPGGYPASRAIQGWRFNVGGTNSNRDPVNYNGDTLTVAVTTSGGQLYDTTQAVPNGFNVGYLKTSAAPDLFIASNKFRLVPTLNYRLTFKFLISSSDNNGISLYPGLLCYDKNGDGIRDGSTLISGGSEFVPGGSLPQVNYRNDITSSAGNRNVWTTTGFDIRITSGNVIASELVFYVDGQVGTPSPYFYIDEVQLKVGNYDTSFDDGVTQTDGFSIVSDSIYTRHIAAEQITTAKIAAGAITTVTLDAEAVTTEKLAVQSANLIRNGYFDRWSGSERYRSGTTNYGAEDDNLVDNWMARLATSETTTFGYYRDTENYKFGSSALMISGLVHDGSNAYIDTEPDPTTGSRYLKLEPSTEYTFGYWAYKYSTSADVGITGYVQTFNSAGATLDTHRVNTSLTSADNGLWKLVTGTFTTSASAYDARVLFTPVYKTYSTPFKFSLDGVVLVKGSELASGYYGEGATIINGNYIRTGRLDADQVNIFSDISSVSISPSGIVVGTPGAKRSELVNTDMSFYDENNNRYKYVKRVEIIDDILTFTDVTFAQPYEEIPIISLSPKIVKTYENSITNDQYMVLYAGGVTTSGFRALSYIATGTNVAAQHGIAAGVLDNNSTTIGDESSYGLTIGSNLPFNEYIAFDNTPAYTCNSIFLRAGVTITGLAQFSFEPNTVDQMVMQFVYGRVNAGNLVVSGYINNAIEFMTDDNGALAYQVAVNKSATFSNLSSSINWGFAIRNFYLIPNLVYGDVEFQSASYIEDGGNLLATNGIVTAVVIERG